MLESRRLASVVVVILLIVASSATHEAPRAQPRQFGEQQVTVLDDGGTADAGEVSDIAVRDSGLPILAYRGDVSPSQASPGQSRLRLFDCADSACSDGIARTLVSDQSVDHLAMAMRNDGTPAIAYSRFNVNLFRCDDAACTSGSTVELVDDFRPRVTDIVIRPGGNPLITLQDSDSRLQVFACNNPDCTSGTQHLIDDGGENEAGGFASAAIGDDGNPVIAYSSISPDNSDGELRFFDCGNAACSSGSPMILEGAGNDWVGSWVSIAIRDDGNPVIGYADSTNNALKAYDCNDAACSSGQARVLDSTSSVGGISVVVRDDGTPFISYHHFENTALISYDCDNADCTSGSRYPLDGIIDDAGGNTAMVMRDSGNPIISYQDDSNKAVKAYDCRSPDCVEGSAEWLDGHVTASVGWYADVAIRNDGRPIIVHQDLDATSAKVYLCEDERCEDGTARPFDSNSETANFGYFASVAIRRDGLPFIVYHDAENDALRAYPCESVDCDSGFPGHTVDEGGTDSVGFYADVAIREDGTPIISYSNTTVGQLQIFDCDNASCTEGTVRVADSGGVDNGEVGAFSSIAIRPNGVPIVSYYNATKEALHLFICSNASCSSGTVRDLDLGGGDNVGWYTSVGLVKGDLPVVAYHDESNGTLMFYQCDDSDCSGGQTKTLDNGDGESVGLHASLAIAGSGNPVISHFNDSAKSLELVYCLDPACDEILTDVVDGSNSGHYSSVAIRPNGEPIVAYQGLDDSTLKAFTGLVERLFRDRFEAP